MLSRIQNIGVHVIGIVSGLGMVVAAFAQNLDNSKTAVTAGAGTVLALGSIVSKLFHDKGINVATITSAGSDVAKALPSLRGDMASLTAFIEGEYPASRSLLQDLQAKVVELSASGPVPTLEQVVAAVMSKFAAGAATQPAPVPAPAATI